MAGKGSWPNLAQVLEEMNHISCHREQREIVQSTLDGQHLHYGTVDRTVVDADFEESYRSTDRCQIGGPNLINCVGDLNAALI
jgi:hypothetical protein